MKYKWACVLIVVALVLLAYQVQGIEPERNRYHQHLEAAEKAPCTDHGEETFCTHLPLMNIVTDGPMPEPYVLDEAGNPARDAKGKRIRSDEMVGATVQYFDNTTENNHLSDIPTLEERALIRIRGYTSREFDKSGYLLKFTQEDMVTKLDVSLSGMTADNNWSLHGPFWDKSLIRNYLCYNFSGEIMEYAPNVRFCEAFVNGEYVGVYLIVEKITFNENGRIDMTKTDPAFATTSYIVRADRGECDPRYALNTFGTYAYQTKAKDEPQGQLEIMYPYETVTDEQHAYITEDLSRFEKALFSYDYNDRDLGYSRYIDVDSFVDYFLINEFTLNYDAMNFSTYLYKDVEDRLKLCVWDFNSAFDYYRVSYVSPATFELQYCMWYKFLFKDEAFVDKVIERYLELREDIFNEEYLFAYIDDTVEYLGPAIERNYEKWGYSFQSTYQGKNYDFLKPTERNVRTYDQAIQQIKDCITQRIDHMDHNLERLYSLSHESVNKQFIHDKGDILG